MNDPQIQAYQRTPRRPLWWSDVVLDLRDFLLETDFPAYIVGGAVRDAYLHHPIHDLDLATPDNPIKLGKQIANAFDGDFYVMDAERGVARAILHHAEETIHIDIAYFRGEGLLADLADRDFTFNAMAVDLRGDLGVLIDPLDGETDLFDKVLRRCGGHSLADDPIRALRAVRHSVRFNARITPDTIADIRAVADELWTISAERLRDEFFKILALNKSTAALRVMDTLGLFPALVPELIPLKDTPHPGGTRVSMWDYSLRTVENLRDILTTISPRRTDLSAAVFDLGLIVMSLDRYRQALQTHLSQVWPDERTHESLLAFAALIHRMDAPHAELDLVALVEDRADALRLSTDERKRLRAIVTHYRQPLTLALDDLSLHRFWHAHGESGIDICLMAMAHYLAEQNTSLKQDAWITVIQRVEKLFDAYFNRHEQIVAPPSLVDGKVLMAALDLPPGKHIGQLLGAIREAQVLDQVHTPQEALDFARNYQESFNG